MLTAIISAVVSAAIAVAVTTMVCRHRYGAKQSERVAYQQQQVIDGLLLTVRKKDEYILQLKRERRKK